MSDNLNFIITFVLMMSAIAYLSACTGTRAGATDRLDIKIEATAADCRVVVSGLEHESVTEQKVEASKPN